MTEAAAGGCRDSAGVGVLWELAEGGDGARYCEPGAGESVRATVLLA